MFMEPSFESLGILILGLFATNCWILIKVSQEIKKDAEIKHRDTMLTLLRELRWLTVDVKHQWEEKFQEVVEQCDEVLADPEASEEDKDRADKQHHSWTQQYLKRFGREHDEWAGGWHAMIEVGAKVREED